MQKADKFKHDNRSNLLVFSDRNSGLQLPERAVAMAMQIFPHGISGDLIA